MTEPVKKILAYQQSPLVCSCVPTGSIPTDFFVSATTDERQYIEARTESPIEPLFYELISTIRAAGIIPGLSPLLLDVFVTPPRVHASIDGISLPLAEEKSTHEYFVREQVTPFIDELKKLLEKTMQRYGHAHYIHFGLLPRFLDKKPVTYDIVTFGQPCLRAATHAPQELEELYERSLVKIADTHTLILVHPKLFATASLRIELLKKLKEMQPVMVAKNN